MFYLSSHELDEKGDGSDIYRNNRRDSPAKHGHSSLMEKSGTLHFLCSNTGACMMSGTE